MEKQQYKTKPGLRSRFAISLPPANVARSSPFQLGILSEFNFKIPLFQKVDIFAGAFPWYFSGAFTMTTRRMHVYQKFEIYLRCRKTRQKQKRRINVVCPDDGKMKWCFSPSCFRQVAFFLGNIGSKMTLFPLTFTWFLFIILCNFVYFFMSYSI